MKNISLTQGLFAVVDDSDFEAVNAFKWYAKRDGPRLYAARNVGWPQKTLRLHQFLVPGVGRIDHINGNGLDNQRHNLRPASNRQNLQGFQRKKQDTSSEYRGVCFNKQHEKWTAGIRVEGTRKHLGYFESEVNAAQAYDDAARKYFGEFACPNFK